MSQKKTQQQVDEVGEVIHPRSIILNSWALDPDSVEEMAKGAGE